MRFAVVYCGIRTPTTRTCVRKARGSLKHGGCINALIDSLQELISLGENQSLSDVTDLSRSIIRDS